MQVFIQDFVLGGGGGGGFFGIFLPGAACGGESGTPIPGGGYQRSRVE